MYYENKLTNTLSDTFHVRHDICEVRTTEVGHA